VKLLLSVISATALVYLSNSTWAGPVVRSAAGSTPADLQAAVDQFRADISLGGGVNAPNTGPFAIGRREINWDGVPDAFSDPNPFPGDFFNNNSKRGAVFSTPGSSLLLSALAANPTATPVRFGSINAAYPAEFQVFSPQRLFTAVGSPITDMTFFVPVSPTTPAAVNGFGAVFTDVEIPGATSIEFFKANNQSLGSHPVPTGVSGGLSFLGVSFDAGERVARVRITSGNAALGATTVDAPGVDVVVMDDFLYGEPIPDITSPAVTINGKTSITTDKANLKIKGTASDAGGIAEVSFKIGGGAFKAAKGLEIWNFKAKLEPGRNNIQVITTDTAGNKSKPAKITVIRE